MKYLVKEPLVDIIIVNWNYARYVADAIKSVKDQSYRNFRCIVVDNGSDDDSLHRIDEAIGNHPQFGFFHLPTNLGQLGGTLWALDHAAGEFVTFLDADDVLFPTYLESHLQAHLGAISSVGFTCSNCVDMNGNGVILTGGNFNMYRFWQHHGVPALRPIERAMRLTGVDGEFYSALSQAVRYLPAHTPYWCWCPGSSNMYRRILLERIRPDPLPTLFGGADSFFLPILHALTGSLLIDQQLSAYRVHGSNDHSALPGLRGIWHMHPKGEALSFGSYLRMLSWLIEHVDEVIAMTGANRYWQVFDIASSTDHRAREAFSRLEFRAAVAARYQRLVEIFGEFQIFCHLRKRLSFHEYLEVLRAARNGAIPLPEYGRVISREIARNGSHLYNTTMRRST